MKKINFSNIFKISNLNNFEIIFKKDQQRIILAIIIILVIILLFRKNLYYLIEQITVIAIIFLLFLVVTKNLVVSIIASIFVFLLINMTINYTNKMEQFQNPIIPNKESDEGASTGGASTGGASTGGASTGGASTGGASTGGAPTGGAATALSAQNIKELISGLSKKPLSIEDTKPTNDNKPNLGLPLPKYSDDIKPTPFRKAQEETYQLIDTIKTLKDTIETFGPVLSEGKKIMSLFENMKI